MQLRFFAALGNTKALCRPHKVMKVVGAGPFPFVLPRKNVTPHPNAGRYPHPLFLPAEAGR